MPRRLLFDVNSAINEQWFCVTNDKYTQPHTDCSFMYVALSREVVSMRVIPVQRLGRLVRKWSIGAFGCEIRSILALSTSRKN